MEAESENDRLADAEVSSITQNAELSQQPSLQPLLLPSNKPRKRKIPERTRWSSRQKTLDFTRLIEKPPKLSPIPKRKKNIDSPLPILEPEGELPIGNEEKRREVEPKRVDKPSTSKLEGRELGVKHEKGIKCNICEKIFKTRPSFNAHRINMHNMAQLKCPEPNCNTSSTTISSLCEHISQHGHALKPFNAVFSTENDFKIWLEDLTKDGSTQFVRPTGGRLKADGTGTQILACSRTGVPRSSSENERAKGSLKIGVTCPAHIRVFYNKDKSVRVTAQLNHYGHECLPQYQTLDQFPAVSETMKKLKSSYIKLGETLSKKLPSNFNIFMSGQALTALNTLKNAEKELLRAIDQIQEIPEAVLRRTQGGGAIQVGIKTQPPAKSTTTTTKEHSYRRDEESIPYFSDVIDSNVAYYVIEEDASLVEVVQPSTSGVNFEQSSNLVVYEEAAPSAAHDHDAVQEIIPEDLLPIHLQDGRVKCPHCQIVLKNMASYKVHKINKHGIYTPRARKPVHQQEQMIEVDRKAICPVCSRNFMEDCMAEFCTFCEKTLHVDCVQPHYENCVYVDYQ